MNVKWRKVGSEIPKTDQMLICKGELSKSYIMAQYDLGTDSFFNIYGFTTRVSHFVYLSEVFDALNENGEIK